MTERSAIDDDARLVAMVDAWLTARAHGSAPELTTLCGERADLLPQLRAMIALAGDLPGGEANDAADVADPLLGRVFAGRYRLTGRLGAGGMGLVYAAHDTQLGRDVAVKVLDDLFAGDPARIERFRREARGLAALVDPHIVAVHDFDLTAQPPFLVMDRIVGFDLAALVRTLHDAAAPRLPTIDDVKAAIMQLGHAVTPALEDLFGKPWPQVVALLGVQMGRAVAAAHDVAVVHRDIKPSNFMLDGKARVRLLDFGLARRETDVALTQTFTRVGTPLYMSPEQVRGEEATPRSDVYSLGATLFELLCLRPPFTGRGSELETKILYDDPPPPQRLLPRLPRDVGAVCMKALHKQPARRYQTARALVEDLERFLRFEPVVASVVLLPAPLRVAVGAYRRYRTPLFVGLTLALLLGAVALVLGHFLGGHRQRQAEVEALAERAEQQKLHSTLSPYLGFAGGREDRLRDPTRGQQLAVLDALLQRAPNDVVARFLRLWVRAEEDPPPASVAADRSALIAQVSAIRFERLYDRVALPLQQRERADRLAARTALQAALRQLDAEPQPLDVLARRLRATVTLQLIEVDFEHASEFCDELRTLVASQEQALGRSAFTCFVRATIAQVDGDLHATRELLLACDRLCPDQPSTLLNLARVLRRLGQPSAARPFAAAAVASFPQPHANYLEQLALTQITLQEFAAAEDVLARFGDDADSRAQHAITLLRLRLRQAALADYSGPRQRSLDDAARVLRTLDELDQEGRLRPRQAQAAAGVRGLVAQLQKVELGSSAAVYFDLLLDRQGSGGADPLDVQTLERLGSALRDKGDADTAALLAAIAGALRRLQKDGVVLR